MRNRIFTLTWLAVLLLVLGLVGTACRSTPPTTSIKTLLDDPARFDGKRVAIQGDVTKSYGVLNYGVYQISDGTGALGVVTSTNGTPRVGAHVGVAGVFHSAFTLGTETAAMLKETQRYTPSGSQP